MRLRTLLTKFLATVVLLTLVGCSPGTAPFVSNTVLPICRTGQEPGIDCRTHAIPADRDAVAQLFSALSDAAKIRDVAVFQGTLHPRADGTLVPLSAFGCLFDRPDTTIAMDMDTMIPDRWWLADGRNPDGRVYTVSGIWFGSSETLHVAISGRGTGWFLNGTPCSPGSG